MLGWLDMRASHSNFQIAQSYLSPPPQFLPSFQACTVVTLQYCSSMVFIGLKGWNGVGCSSSLSKTVEADSEV